ncbi:MAG TPA: extracellular solute-binding protein [Clostridiales bacterium]|jgi:ABC-type glycerol-3-phosphate transport system substrate-binding protein|nr:extracellular solute-binding protein [Clostridiales bacterium]
MKMKKILSMLLVLALALSLMACKGKEESNGGKNNEKTSGGSVEGTMPTIDSLELGTDYTDIKADLEFLTHRTDIVDTRFQEYIAEFQKMYPNINITYEAITDYAEDVTIRLTTDDWGDICMIPTTVQKSELPGLFVSFGTLEGVGKNYDYLNNFAFEGNVYGIPSTVNAQGIVYNKKVFEEAGVTEIPKTPEEYLDALQKIKDNTDAIPMYTNFAAGWTMGAWDAYIGGSATGDPDFMNNVLVHSKNPFADRGDQTGPYAVYYTLYEAVVRGLIEDDPTTTDWEGCKGMINRGEIGTLVLGSWAVTQMQGAGPNADDIGYMPFPITVDGKQYASAGPDYCYGINVKSSDDEKIAAMLYVKWLTEKSNFAYDEGGIPIVKGAEYPPTLASFDGIKLVIDNPAPAGEETLFNEVNTESELGINMENTHVQRIVEAAMDKSETLNDIVNDWNQKWSDAQQKLNVQVK